MKRNTSKLILYLLASGFFYGLAYAQDELEERDPQPLVPDALVSRPIVSEIELGLGYVSDDAYKFGRYNGMQNDSAFLLGDIKVREYFEGGNFLSVRGTNLGLESRSLLMGGGEQGAFKFFIQYDELPNYKDNTVMTPFIGVEGDKLTLPSGFDIDANLDNNLNSFELKTKRERLSVGANIIPKKHWQFDINLSHESKQGVDATGSAIANGATQVVVNANTALLPEPIDYETDILNAVLHYDGDDAQFNLTYHMSLFNNNDDALSWQNPFNPVSSSGNMSLAADNEFHQLSVTAGYTLPFGSRLTALASIGRMTQNQKFQPYTINTTLTTSALPRDSLAGEVLLSHVQLKLSSRPTNKLRINAELRYNERDNRTPIDSYDYVVLDSHAGGTIQNRPYSHTNNRFNLDANYRFNALSSLHGGYKYNEMKRSYIDVEREQTQEDTFFARWKLKPSSSVDIALYAEEGSRDGSTYNALINENPTMRKYHLADRDRTNVGAKIDYMATEKLFLSARADYNKDDYSSSVLGLTEATQPVYSVDITYQPRHNITTYGYYVHENIQSSQNGLDIFMNTGSKWQADYDDIFYTAGIGARLYGIGKWDIGLDVVHSESTGVITMTDLAAPGTENQFPDTVTALTSVKLWTRYKYNKQLTYKLGLGFEDYEADNWAVDGLLPYEPTVVNNTLLMGNETLDYNVYVVSLSAIYKFQ